MEVYLTLLSQQLYHTSESITSAISYVLSFRLFLATFTEPFDLETTFLTGDTLPEDCDELPSFRSCRPYVLLQLFTPPFTSPLDASALE
jgi:hypothetical protein